MRGSWDNLHLTGEETEAQSTWVKHQSQGEDAAELGVKPSPASLPVRRKCPRGRTCPAPHVDTEHLKRAVYS